MVRDSDRPLEMDLLLILAVFMVILGMLMFGARSEHFPLSEDSIYGLSLVLFGFDAMTIGKTPFGDVRRSWVVLAIGLSVASLGMIVCFIPHVLTRLARISVGFLLLAGGFGRVLQLFAADDRARSWMREGGVLAQMAFASALAYLLRIAAGVALLAPGFVNLRWTWALFLAFGASLLYSAWALRRVSMDRPEAAREDVSPAAGHGWLDYAELPLSLANLLLTGALLILQGVLLFPVGVGLLPYSADGLFGLMLVLMAIQAMALGATPLGELKRPTSMLLVGLSFAGLGIVASIVPGLMTEWLRILIAVLNVGNGAKLLLETYRRLTSKRAGAGHSASAVGALNATITAVGALTIVFGVAMLFPDILPLPVIAVLSILMGLAIFLLVTLLRSQAPLEPKPA